MTAGPRRILITGASSGLGAALALHYAQPGVDLLLLARNSERLERVAGECWQRGASVTTALVDVRESTALAAFIASADAMQPIDTVIANAGIEASLGAGGEAEPWPVMLDQLRTNLEGALATVQPLLDPMRARGHGRIVLVASLAGRAVLPDQPTYSATKAALIAFGEAIRPLMARSGVTVTVACPGFIATGMAEDYAGWRLLECSAGRAAALIAGAAERGQRHVAFPWPLAMLARLDQFAPAWLRDAVVRAFFRVRIGS